MLNKFKILYVFLIFSTFVVFCGCPFLGKRVNAVSGGKSSGVITKTVCLPFNNFDGVSISFENDYDHETFLEKSGAKLLFIEDLDGVKNYYYYSKRLPKCEVVNQKKVNIQIAISNEKVVIGTPIIYGGY